MQNKFKKSLIFISIIILILFIVAFWFLYNQVQKKNVNSEKVLTEWQVEDARRNEIKTIMKSIQTIQTNNELIEMHFAKGSNFVPFLDTIDSFAPKIGGEDEVVSVDITPETQELIVGIKVLGSFEAIYKFLTLLENSPYEIEFLAMDIQKGLAQNVADKNGKSAVGIKSEKTGKFFPWEGLFKIKLLSFMP